MAKIPTILEAGRADGKLITSDSIFDENKGIFQSELNDIQDTLNSDNPNKPLSANQGKILKELLDAKVIEAGDVPIDTEPIEGNITHLVNSDGLAKEFNKHNTAIIQGNIYDVSFYNNSAVFDSIQSLLNSSNLNTLIPPSVQHGGMSIRFIQSSDNKYVQYRLTNQKWSIDVDDWQEIGSAEFSTGEKVSEIGIDDEPTAGSDNLITSGSVAAIQKGNLKKKSGITTIDLDIANFTLLNNSIATISDGHIKSSVSYRIYYLQIDADCEIIYKLGANNIEGNATLFICDSQPATGVAFTNPIERVGNSEGSFTIMRGQYLCVQGYSTIDSYLPSLLKKEVTLFENINIFDKLGEKESDSSIKAVNVWSAIEEVNSNIPQVNITVSSIKPLMVDTASFFWTHKQATNFNQDNPFKVSGIANSNTLNVLSDGQDTSVLTSEDNLASIVVKFDDGTCKPYMLTGWTEDTLTIYPTIDKSITDGEVVPLMNDSQHLTIYGYNAYSQHLFEENPRYCEKNKYIERYNGGMKSIKFSALPGTPYRYDSSRNDNSYYSCQYGKTGIFLIPFTDYLTESQYGYQWEVSTKNVKGYVESYVGVCNGFYPANTFTLDEGYEIHIEGWIDGVKSYEKIKDNIFIERICIPFEKDVDKVKIKIYLTKMRNSKDTLYIGATTFWVNESSRTNMIEPHEVVSQLFDSWGNYDATDYIEDEDGHKWYQGSSGKELQRLINDKNGIIIPYFNRSKGSMTTRWGKSWWYHNVWSIHPDIMLTDFGINDYHTSMAQFPDFTDPYGNTINMTTAVTSTEFYQNMETLFNMCITHNIVPIYIMCSRIGCDINYINTFVGNHAQQLSLT